MKRETGILIAFEGIDGAGKRTQIDLLARYLERIGANCYVIGFPRYDTFFGKLVGSYLRGELGPLYEISPYLASLPYALDRFEARTVINTHLDQGVIVLADRYVGSNLAHHSVKLPPEERDAFINWLWHLEYNILGLPDANLTILLKTSPLVASDMVKAKPPRPYTTKEQDIHEEDINYQSAVAEQFEHLASQLRFWTTIDTNASGGGLLTKEMIHSMVVDTVRETFGLIVDDPKATRTDGLG